MTGPSQSPEPMLAPLGIVGPYPPYRGGIAHFTERLHRAVENHVAEARAADSQAADSQAADGQSPHHVPRSVVGISFSRQYPGWLYPGSNQEAPPPTEIPSGPAAPAATAEMSPGHPVVRRDLDSMCPWTGRRAARHLRDAGVTEVVFMVWMPFFCPVYLSVLNGLRRGGVRSGAAAPSIRTTAIVHNAIPHEWQPFARPLMRHMLRRMDRVVALSGNVADDIAALGGRRREDIEVQAHPVYNQFGEAVDKAFARSELGLRELAGAEEEVEPDRGGGGAGGGGTGRALDVPPLILFFGLVRKYKGLDVLLEAVARLTREPGNALAPAPTPTPAPAPAPASTLPHVLVAGEFYDDESSYRDLVAKLGLTDRVHFHARYIPDNEVRLYFSAADVVVQPYRHATQSGVVQTAYQFGRPVIVTRVGGLPDMVRHGEDGLIAEPDDPAALAATLAHALQPHVLQKLTEGATTARDRTENDWASFAALFVPDSDPADSPDANLT